MATERQEKALEKLVEGGRTKGQALIEAGYSPNTAKAPTKVTESKGFKELCDDYGLTDSLIINSLVEDIKGKAKNRKPELELGAKIKGMLTDKLEIRGNINIGNLLDDSESDS